MKAQITLTSSESKRLIARSILSHPKIKDALADGIIIINLGSTNAYVAEELLKKEFPKERFMAGMIDERGTCVVPRNERIPSVVLRKGKISDEDPEKITRSMGPGDVFIKGANAVDKSGKAWVMLASETGGTIGHVLGTLMARGVSIIIPVGLEKYVPNSLDEAATKMGIHRLDCSIGVPVGIISVPGEIISEVEALKLMGDVDVTVVGGGGIGSGEGSYTFLIEGGEKEVKDIFKLVKQIKGEKSLSAIRGKCESCIYTCPDKK
jgi:hypothetical protein